MSTKTYRFCKLVTSLAVLFCLGSLHSTIAEQPPIIFQDRFETGRVVAATSWTQHAADAGRSSYVAQFVPTPWRWKWAWNGPDANGAIAPGKTSLPRNVQPITGSGRVYVAAGSAGLIALDQNDGSELWRRSFDGPVQTTPAWDPASDAVLAVSLDGRVHRLNAASGATLAVTNVSGAGATPPLLVDERLFVAAGSELVALAASSLDEIWRHDAGSNVETAAAYSVLADRLVIGTADLYVHAVDAANGSGVWRVKPTLRVPPMDPDQLVYAGDEASYRHGWPVVADAHGLVLIKLRLDWQTMWSFGEHVTNESMRQFMLDNPDQQALMVLGLDTGQHAFVANIAHGGYGNGNYMPMGPQPVIRTTADGNQRAFMIIRGSDLYDGRWDSHFGELVLDDRLPDWTPGDVRWISYPGRVDYLLTDEQPNLSMAGNQLLGGHWMAGYAIELDDQTPPLGSYSAPITSTALPHIVTSSNRGQYNPDHWDPGPLVQDDDAREFPFGFYIYWDRGAVYDQYWSEYASWVVSDGLVLFRSTDGALVALEHGEPVIGPAQAYLQAIAPLPTSEQERTHLVLRDDQTRTAVGQYAEVHGRIRSVFNNGKAVQLSFAEPHRGHFKILIERQHWPSFGPALGTDMGWSGAGMFAPGQRVAVTGRLDWYQGDPVIRASSADQIRFHAD